MLRYVTGQDLVKYPKLRATMLRDRAAQFSDRLGWAVAVDDAGFEQDQYDALNPLYVIWQRPDGCHGGSMRFLPTTGRCMVNEHFLHLNKGAPLYDPAIWECTRFCLAPGAGPHVAAALMLAGGELLERQGLRHFVGVFDANMERIYRRIGACPDILGHAGEGRDKVRLGLWSLTPEARTRVARRARLSSALSDLWYRRAFGDATDAGLARTA
ncbi:autoinducer synthase [Seohaeicola saemankumensis]|uniref:acyl-homoserine-lactone synthase n=1 Tax=Seohaeicola saemankumensis TaxID=481181 RepID=UPI001E486A8A|nr:acyl-homoserine-lactone synthase [Seohaeicola saemankumensis]MCD1626138.1 autoinducer synthase [Seohaeicola saemankumensis]